MSKVTVRAKTVDEAVEKALSQLEASKHEVTIRVVEEPSKGFLGFGAKQAVVEVEKLEVVAEESKVESVVEQLEEERLENGLNPIQEAHTFLTNVCTQMGLRVEIDVVTEEDHTLFQVKGSKLGVLIGRRGQTLDSLQYLTNIVANKHTNEYTRIVIDTENYRKKRKETLEQLADRVAKKVVRTQTKVVLEPMNPAERKIIHTYLQNHAGIATKSEGVEPQRKVVIFPK